MNLLDRLGLGRPTARIAPATQRHTARLAEIHAGAFARPWTAEEFEVFLTEASVRIDALFLGRDGQPAGFVVSRSAADEAEILSLALARFTRGRGDAGRLLRQHLQTLAHAGIATVHLEVEEGNGPAIGLYRRTGFVNSGHRPGYYARPDGSRSAAISMTLQLVDPSAGP